MEHLTAQEETIGKPKGLALDFGQSSQNVDQSVQYNITGGESGGAAFARLFSANPNLLYWILAAVALLGFAALAGRKRKKK